MNKKGNITAMLIFVAALFTVLIIGFLMITGSSIVNWVFDEVTPELSNLGTIGSTNMTKVASQTLAPVNGIIQSFTWLTGIIYVMMLVGCFGFIILAGGKPSGWLIGFYFALIFVLIIGLIFMSNIYEDFYDDGDDLSTRLREHTILSFMILYSPAILTILAFMTGIVLFSGVQQEEFT